MLELKPASFLFFVKSDKSDVALSLSLSLFLFRSARTASPMSNKLAHCTTIIELLGHQWIYWLE